MGLFKSLKGKLDVGTDDPTQSSSQDQYNTWSTSQEKHRIFGRSDEDPQFSTSNTSHGRAGEGPYAPPPGPPPSQRRGQGGGQEFAPPPDPPPSHRQNQTYGGESVDGYAPPPGPPPSQRHHLPSSNNADGDEEFAPPPGPPPSQSPKDSNPPPYHDWTVIPDTALLPPPPPLPQDYSPTNNASYVSAARAHEWCMRHPVFTPSMPAPEIYATVARGEMALEKPPPALTGRGFTLRREGGLTSSTWRIKTGPTQQDAVTMSSLPMYFAAVDNPARTRRQKTIYFEITVRGIANANSGVAIGFAAKPYPPWRLPGWHRASIGVHGDDGRRFVNDAWGGRDFVDAFQPHQTIGVGMTFSTQQVSGNTVKTSAFVTRDGRTDFERWRWEIDEERDERDEGVDGLMGEGDLYAAIGVFGGVEVDVKFRDGLDWRPEV
ncbi:uncharacterized protein Z518_02673 [Rhinocladiella mackenziei CBS 650.93]|uniref:SPRY domain-containing protein n=1 Tax=Rhinocladiella mackenziei CBS 650.93 TaxID=1442369 RepID=A0A0D2HC72_9EURO|nr:uncharacterized protein Z518_02673 [Rhinocladiella mackenziei CBS 650.93]KIX08018.1 hypothetical protein Z518_02673 [Rhinocladiella mackenziei CBS 650.93]